MKKILTVYYSYSGNTKKIAEKIHDALGGDIAASCKAEEKGVTIKKGLNLRFDGNAMRTPQSELNGWISAIAKEEF